MTSSRALAAIMFLLTFVSGWCCYVFLVMGSGLALLLMFASIVLAYALRVGDIDACQLVGHRYDPEGERHGYYDCERCEAVGYEPQPTLGSRVRAWIDWKLYLFQEWRAWRFAWWWRTRVRCNDCGAWMGQHTDDCLPF